MWFCFFETQLNEEKRVRYPSRFELEDGAWPNRNILNDWRNLDTDYGPVMIRDHHRAHANR